MENADSAVLDAEFDIALYATHIHTEPLFWVLLLIGIITIIILWKKRKLKEIIIPMAVVNVFSSLIGSVYHDGFVKDIYHGGYEFDFCTTSGVCFIVSVSTLFILLGYIADCNKKDE